MVSTRAELNAAVRAERRKRVTALSRTAPVVLLTLPPTAEEKVEVFGKPILFTTYVEKEEDGRLLVLVRSDESRFLGMVTSGATDGFWVLRDGSIAEASDEDVLEYFG
jgi:hypothetical protein